MREGGRGNVGVVNVVVEVVGRYRIGTAGRNVRPESNSVPATYVPFSHVIQEEDGRFTWYTQSLKSSILLVGVGLVLQEGMPGRSPRRYPRQSAFTASTGKSCCDISKYTHGPVVPPDGFIEQTVIDGEVVLAESLPPVSSRAARHVIYAWRECTLL